MFNRERTTLIAVFPSRKLLIRALDALRDAERLHIERAAVVARDHDGDVTVVGDSLGPDEAGITGGTFGAAIALFGLMQFGALALPGIGVVLALGTGALVGGLVGSATGRFAANLLENAARPESIGGLHFDIEEEQPALVMVLRDAEVIPQICDILTRYRGRLIEQPVAETS
jgi:uncharacterized membrane protein